MPDEPEYDPRCDPGHPEYDPERACGAMVTAFDEARRAITEFTYMALVKCAGAGVTFGPLFTALILHDAKKTAADLAIDAQLESLSRPSEDTGNGHG